MTSNATPAPSILDLSQTKCPLNFVKAKLALEKLPLGQVLDILIVANSKSALNVPDSLSHEGYQPVEQRLLDEGLLRLRFMGTPKKQ
jgi:TusA-related sulfurtransferase